MNANNMIPFSATAGVSPYRIMKPGTNDGEAIQATASTEKYLGISDNLTLVSGDKGDMAISGKHFLTLGGTVAAGDDLTSDANGCGVTAAPATGVNASIACRALVSGVSGDIIPVNVFLNTRQG